ncbi:HAD family phosphatase [Flavobacteriales bacterium]|nr:HAD family phosphatase [Flavobacteriales bacterium]
MKNIKHIIFDLGNVILNIEYQKTINEFNKIGIKDASVFYSQSIQQEIFNLLETGKISEFDFLIEVNKLCPKASHKQILSAWNALILDLPQKRISLINNLKSNFSIYLLSNTNVIHINEIKKKIGVKKYNRFYNLFNKVYYSHEIGLRKPNPEAFNIILNENDLNVNEVLFIDDSIQHIKTAKKLGVKTYHLTKDESIEAIFPDIVQ